MLWCLIIPGYRQISHQKRTPLEHPFSNRKAVEVIYLIISLQKSQNNYLSNILSRRNMELSHVALMYAGNNLRKQGKIKQHESKNPKEDRCNIEIFVKKKYFCKVFW